MMKFAPLSVAIVLRYWASNETSNLPFATDAAKATGRIAIATSTVRIDGRDSIRCTSTGVLSARLGEKPDAAPLFVSATTGHRRVVSVFERTGGFQPPYLAAAVDQRPQHRRHRALLSRRDLNRVVGGAAKYDAALGECGFRGVCSCFITEIEPQHRRPG